MKNIHNFLLLFYLLSTVNSQASSPKDNQTCSSSKSVTFNPYSNTTVAYEFTHEELQDKKDCSALVRAQKKNNEQALLSEQHKTAAEHATYSTFKKKARLQVKNDANNLIISRLQAEKKALSETITKLQKKNEKHEEAARNKSKAIQGIIESLTTERNAYRTMTYILGTSLLIGGTITISRYLEKK